MAPGRPPGAVSTLEGSSGAMADAQVGEQIGEDPALQLAGGGEKRSWHLSSGEDGRGGT